MGDRNFPDPVIHRAVARNPQNTLAYPLLTIELRCPANSHSIVFVTFQVDHVFFAELSHSLRSKRMPLSDLELRIVSPLEPSIDEVLNVETLSCEMQYFGKKKLVHESRAVRFFKSLGDVLQGSLCGKPSCPHESVSFSSTFDFHYERPVFA